MTEPTEKYILNASQTEIMEIVDRVETIDAYLQGRAEAGDIEVPRIHQALRELVEQGHPNPFWRAYWASVDETFPEEAQPQISEGEMDLDPELIEIIGVGNVIIIDSYLVSRIKQGDQKAYEVLEAAHQLTKIVRPNDHWTEIWLAELQAINGTEGE